MIRSGWPEVAAFGESAQRYDEGWLGQLHHQIADRTADLGVWVYPNDHL
jgi:hypothetical protein